MKVKCNVNKNVKRLLLLAAGIVLVTIADAQITIDNGDMPSPGDTIRTSVGLNAGFYDFELTGEDYTWDFENLISLSQTVDTFVSVTETPIFYWPFFLLSANLATSTVPDSPIEQIPLEDVFTFYKNSSDNFRDLGFAATLFSLPLPFKYNDPDILYDFPMNYGNVDSSESGFEFGLENFGYILVERKRVNTVDGWGTLTTPYGTFEVLRMKSEVNEFDSIYIDSISIGIPIERQYTEYKWMGKGQKIPLLKVTDNLFGLVAVYIDSVRNLSTGIDLPDIASSRLLCYPNPSSGIINVELAGPSPEARELTIYNLNGEAVYRRKLAGSAQGIWTVDLDRLSVPHGYYFVELVSGNNRIRQKIIYTH